MNLKRVVVTGLGALTPIGNNKDDYWKNLLKGKSGCAPITYFDTEHFKTKFACELKNYNVSDFFDRKEARKTDKFAQYAMVASTEAISDAKEKDVIINTIYCGSYDTGISGKWKDGADYGGGDYMTINQDKKIVHIVTPYDGDIIILNKKLNKTYIYFGSEGWMKFANQTQQDGNAQKLSEEVAVKRAVSKSNRLYQNSSWDLVDRSDKETIDYSKLDKKKLPEHLQQMSDAELKEYVKKQKKIRTEIKAKINELNQKRRAYIAQKQRESAKNNELESVIINAIKKQAMKKNYSW